MFTLSWITEKELGRVIENKGDEHGNSKRRWEIVLFSLFFFALFKPIIRQFFTILQDKLHSFNIQDDQSTRFLCTTNYSIDHIIKRFHEENSIMPGLFSKKNLVLCDMQGNN